MTEAFTVMYLEQVILINFFVSEVTCHKCRQSPSEGPRSIPITSQPQGVEFCNWNLTRLILGYFPSGGSLRSSNPSGDPSIEANLWC